MHRMPIVGKFLQKFDQKPNKFAAATDVNRNKREVEMSHRKTVDLDHKVELTLKYANEPSHREFRRLEVDTLGSPDPVHQRNRLEDVMAGGGDDVLDDKPKK